MLKTLCLKAACALSSQHINKIHISLLFQYLRKNFTSNIFKANNAKISHSPYVHF